jgi:hypothetical protein
MYVYTCVTSVCVCVCVCVYTGGTMPDSAQRSRLSHSYYRMCSLTIECVLLCTQAVQCRTAHNTTGFPTTLNDPAAFDCQRAQACAVPCGCCQVLAQASVSRSLLPYNRPLLPYNRPLLPYDRSLLPYDRSLLPYDRSLLPYASRKRSCGCCQVLAQVVCMMM